MATAPLSKEASSAAKEEVAALTTQFENGYLLDSDGEESGTNSKVESLLSVL